MNPEPAIAFEADPRFPSGAWTGFFQQTLLLGRHTTNVQLTFEAGQLWGQGSDVVGAYSMRGSAVGIPEQVGRR